MGLVTLEHDDAEPWKFCGDMTCPRLFRIPSGCTPESCPRTSHSEGGVAIYLGVMIALAKTGETPVTEFLRQRFTNALKIVDAHLARQPFLVGDRASIADLSLCGYLFWPEEIGVDWSAYPAIAAWLDRIRSMPGWVHPYALMPGHPLPAKT